MCFCIPYQSKASKGVSSAKCVNYRSFLRPCSPDHECRLAALCTLLRGWQIVLSREWMSSAWGETKAWDNSLQGWLLWGNSSLCTWVSSSTEPSCILLVWFPVWKLTLFFHSSSPHSGIGSQNTAKVLPYLCYHQYIMLLLKDMNSDVGRAADGCLLKPE